MRALFASVLVALLLWLARSTERAAPPPRAVAPPHGEALPTRPSPRRGPPPRPRTAGAQCNSAAAVRCFHGDVWAFDSCGEPEEKLDECEARPCDDASCAPEPSTPCPLPGEGRCVGNTVELCLGGALERVDCAARGLVCLEGGEGAECGAPFGPESACPRIDFCEGDVLVACRAGRAERLACGLFGARCVRLAGRAAECVAARPALPADACGACGCARSGGEARCDGVDEDGDAVIDEGADCGPVPVVAFVVGDDDGNTSHASEDVEAELTRANALFAAGPEGTPTQFALAQTVALRDTRLAELDEDELDGLANDATVHGLRPGFYVPLLFTERLITRGGVPKAGLSSLPNGSCGGVQLGVGTERGLVAVAKGRSPTTVAHELGHFFGLCHTHERLSELVRASLDARGALTACSPACASDGDGICDTAEDPGLAECTVDALCSPVCARGEQAPVDNVMSYYTPCRRLFTEEQLARVARSLALRRAWEPCLREGCRCDGGGAGCPAEMGCRPGPDGPRCALAGQRVPGAPCEDARQCLPAALCVTRPAADLGRCARLCTGSAPGCTCTNVTTDLSICTEDVAAPE